MKKLEINIPIYNQQVVVLQADSMETMDSYIKDTYNVFLEGGPAECRWATTYPLPNNILIVGLLPNTTNDIIVHETGHATFELMNIIGINPVSDQETFCYIQEFLFNKITTWIHKDD